MRILTVRQPPLLLPGAIVRVEDLNAATHEVGVIVGAGFSPPNGGGVPIAIRGHLSKVVDRLLQVAERDPLQRCQRLDLLSPGALAPGQILERLEQLFSRICHGAQVTARQSPIDRLAEVVA